MMGLLPAGASCKTESGGRRKEVREKSGSLSARTEVGERVGLRVVSSGHKQVDAKQKARRPFPLVLRVCVL